MSQQRVLRRKLAGVATERLVFRKVAGVLVEQHVYTVGGVTIIDTGPPPVPPPVPVPAPGVAPERITVTNATGGTLRVRTPAAGSPFTNSTGIQWNATAAQVKVALEALPGIGPGNLIVTGNPGGPWDIVPTQDSGLDAPDISIGSYAAQWGVSVWGQVQWATDVNGLSPSNATVTLTGVPVAPPPPDPTPPPTPDPTPTPPPVVVPPATGTGMWISTTALAALPTTGAAWSSVAADAQGSWGSPAVGDQNSNHDVLTFAGALYAARTGDAAMAQKVRDALVAVQPTLANGPYGAYGRRALALGRNLPAYVLAADLIGYQDAAFRSWVNQVITIDCPGGGERTVVLCSEARPNNWGTHCIAARTAAAIYLGNNTELARCATLLEGWTGNRAKYAGFKYTAPASGVSWQANAALPVGVNPAGSTIQNRNVDGVLPDDQRRSGGFTWPPPYENYVHEALQGVVVAAWMMYRQGLAPFGWQSGAIGRAFKWMSDNTHGPVANDIWMNYIVNKAYGTSYPASISSVGKNMSYTYWTHA